MSQAIEVKVPDIGDFSGVPVIEVLVKPGDSVQAETPLVTLESDKATMDVPSPVAGTVKELKVSVGDKVSEGTPILVLEAVESEKTATPGSQTMSSAAQAPARPVEEAATKSPAGAASGGVIEVKVPDIGDFSDVPVIEVLVKPGDSVQAETPLITLESDKATMDVPSPAAGTVTELKVKVGDKVSKGATILLLSSGAAAPSREPAPAQGEGAGWAPAAAPTPPQEAIPSAPKGPPLSPSEGEGRGGDGSRPPVDSATFIKAHASPSVRKFARELGVDLSQVTGSGPKGRILHSDVEAFAKGGAPAARPAPAAAAAEGAGLGLLAWPKVDFNKFGPTEVKPLSRIKKISGANLHRNWVMIPHVTNHEDADITELEAFRLRLNKEIEKSGVKVSMLSFLIQACVAALRKFPTFNASLDGENLVLKRYYHIGFAADTPNGLMVPVIRDADRKGVVDIAREMGDLAKLAREGKLKPDQMQGGCFSISSLGGIGGTYFTPIINAPEVAILGVCKSVTRPVWDGRDFAPRLILPLSLSWDHRVIDGAEAARFNVYLAQLLGDLRRVVL